MNKKLLLQDLSDGLSKRSGETKKKTESFLRFFFSTIEDALKNDSIVKIKGFGTFKLISVESRKSVDVNTGERIEIDGHTKVTFTPDISLKDLINKPFAHFQTVVLDDDTRTEEMEYIGNLEDSDKEEESDKKIVDDTKSVPPQVYSENFSENTENNNSETTKLSAASILSEDTTDENFSEMESEKENLQPKINDKENIDSEDVKDNPTCKSNAFTELVQVNPPSSDSGNKWWKWLLICVSLLSLMVLSYFAGYFRIFCPCEYIDNKVESISDKISDDSKVKDTVNVRIVNKLPIDTLDAKPIPVPTANWKQYPQVPYGRYWITGTLKIRKILYGETLRSIALEEYGSKTYVPYIVIYNQIKNPDNIIEGMSLQIPKLVLKENEGQ